MIHRSATRSHEVKDLTGNVYDFQLGTSYESALEDVLGKSEGCIHLSSS